MNLSLRQVIILQGVMCQLKNLFCLFLTVGAPMGWAEQQGDRSDRTHSPLITNGETAESGQFPWQAAVYADTGSKQAFCGGSLIAASWVLTAAHCVKNMKGFRVVLGALHLRNETEDSRQEFLVPATSSHVHPRWSSFTLQNDIALLQLPTPAILNDRVATIPLAVGRDGDAAVGAVATVSGWGLQSDKDDSIAESLQFTSQKVISNPLCNLYYPLRVKSSHLCISGVNAKSTCQGDSGGPLVVPAAAEKPAWRQVGVVSFGIAFGCEVGWPAVFTRVSSFIPYVSRVTGIAF